MKKILMYLCAALAIVLCTSSVFAFSTGSYRVDAKNASYTWGSDITSTYKTAWENAANDWYNVDNVTFYYSSSSSNIVNARSISGDSAYGTIYYQTTSGNKLQKFKVELNTLKCTNGTIAHSTSGHEIGHALGLADLTSGTAIMNKNRNRSSIYTPQTDDIDGVKYVYGY